MEGEEKVLKQVALPREKGKWEDIFFKERGEGMTVCRAAVGAAITKTHPWIKHEVLKALQLNPEMP